MPNKSRRASNKPAFDKQNMSHTLRAEGPPQSGPGSQVHQALVYCEEAGLMVEVQTMAEDIVTKLNQARDKNRTTGLRPSERTEYVFGAVRGRIITALRNALLLLEGPHESSHGSATSVPIATRQSLQPDIPQSERPPHCADVPPHVHYHTHNLGVPHMPTAAQGSYHLLVQQHGHPSCYPYSSHHAPSVPYGPCPQPNPYPQSHQPERSPSPAHAYLAGQHDLQFHIPSHAASVQAGIPQDQGN